MVFLTNYDQRLLLHGLMNDFKISCNGQDVFLSNSKFYSSISKMIKLNLLIESKNKKDKRKKTYRLTDKGLAVASTFNENRYPEIHIFTGYVKGYVKKD